MDFLNSQTEESPQASRIKLLPEPMIDQIKAGEVLERPSGLLKELMENALDAGAKKITLQIINNGLDLFSIEDDGSGMSLSELPLAFARHATSKIETFSDLYRLSSYGFRGEALAATAAVAKVTCSTFSSERNSGGKIVLEGGHTLALSQLSAGQAGTSIFVRDLFFNTPARLKFIRSKLAEKNALKKMLQSFLLAHPQVQFSVKWDEGEKEIYPACPGERVQERIKKILFKTSAKAKTAASEELCSFEQTHDRIVVRGYFSAHPTPSNRQFIFVNNRYVSDKNLHQSVIHGLEAQWKNDSGHYVLFVDLPPELVDVNVHPNKTTIKFEKPSLIHSLVYSAVKKAGGSLRPFGSFERRPQGGGHHILPTPTPASVPAEFQGLMHESLIRKIGPRFSIWEESHQWYFFDGAKFFSLAFLAYWKSHQGNLQAESMPLLVGAPYEYPASADHRLEEMKKMGIEVDRLSRERVVVRGLPKFLYEIPTYPFLLQQMLKALSSSKESLADFLARDRSTCLGPNYQELAEKYFPKDAPAAQELRILFQNCLQEINVGLLQQLFD